MPRQAEKIVRIESEDGKRHAAVTEADFKHRKMVGLGGKTYQDAGYTIASYEDGTPYEDGQEPGKHALDKRVGTPEIGEEPAPKQQTETPRRASAQSANNATPQPTETVVEAETTS